MILVLSRHGEASRPEPGSPPVLTPRGQSEVLLMAEHLSQKKKLKISSIWHSPITRAVQTAEIYRTLLKLSPSSLHEKQTLEPDADPGITYEEILAWTGGNLLIISHLPFLPNLTGFLSKGTNLSFPTAGIAAFEYLGRFNLLWALDPSSPI